jgi:hypothetical protein
MGKRSKKGRKSKTKSQSASSPDGGTGDVSARDPRPLTSDGGRGNEPPVGDSPSVELKPFGFDEVCQRCTQLYRSALSVFAFDETQSPDTGMYIGNLAHISSNAPCRMCRKLFVMRWSDSATGQYHLHAFSAARMVCGQSIGLLRASLSSKSRNRTLQDTALLAVVADCTESVPISSAIEQSRHRGFLISCNIQLNGEQQPPPPLVKKKDFDDDDLEQHWWLSRTIGDRQKYSRVPMKAALQQAGQTGFINEYKSRTPWGLLGCNSTSISGLEQQEAFGETHVNFLSIQPTETGDPNTPGNLGYMPHNVRSSETPPIQSLQSEVFSGRASDSATIDYSLLRGWIRQCQKRCDIHLQKFTRERKRFQRIPFYLLDCRKREVFKVSSKRNHRYIALSYVWGDSDTNTRPRVSQLPFSVSERCPTVIEDAMTVVLELGYRYLWVDSFCISPEASSRHEQIANMDVVYKNAELTIVAAAGNNADYGLPGAGSRQRLQQTQIKVGKHHYVSTTMNPSHCLETSTYQSRGWTYQEFFFSRRRLVFSDQEVSFACRSFCMALHHQESLSCPSGNLPTYEKIPEELEDEDLEDAYFHKLPANWKDILYRADGSVEDCEILLIDKVFALLSYEHHVSQFTKRKLSFDIDSLQAVSSILDRFAYECHSIYHLHGLPFIPKSRIEYIESFQRHLFKFKYGLLWTHGPQSTPVRRRPAFPSWSWTGWEGQVNWLVGTTNTTKLAESPASDARFDFLCFANSKRGKLRSVDDWRPHAQNNPAPEALVFSGLLYNIPLRVSDEACVAERGIYLDTGDNYCRSRLHVTQIDLDLAVVARKTFQGLWLGSGVSGRYVLVVRETASRGNRFGGRYFERVGVMAISGPWSGWKAPLGVQGWLV